MNDYEKLFFPFHYKWIDMTKELSDADFGMLIRKLIGGFISDADEPKDLPIELLIPYRFIKDAAERVIDRRKKAGEAGRLLAEKRWGNEASVPKEKTPCGDEKQKSAGRYGKGGTKHVNFDVNEVFERALKRSYGDSNYDTNSESNPESPPNTT